jgi:hypothetical protein
MKRETTVRSDGSWMQDHPQDHSTAQDQVQDQSDRNHPSGAELARPSLTGLRCIGGPASVYGTEGQRFESSRARYLTRHFVCICRHFLSGARDRSSSLGSS